jgi:hypothetical protein
MHKRKIILLVIRAGFDSKLTGFVSGLKTFTGCVLLLVPGGLKSLVARLSQ